MPDDSKRFEIKTVIDATGAVEGGEKTAEALEKIEEHARKTYDPQIAAAQATEKVGEAAVETAKDLGQAAVGAGGFAGEMAEIAGTVAGGAVFAAIVGGIGLVIKAWKDHAQAVAEQKQAIEDADSVIDDLSTKIREQIKTSQGLKDPAKEWKDSLHDANTELDLSAKFTNTIHASQMRLLDAREKLQLATIAAEEKDPDTRARRQYAVRQAYAGYRGEEAQRTAQEQIAREQQTIADQEKASALARRVSELAQADFKKKQAVETAERDRLVEAQREMQKGFVQSAVEKGIGAEDEKGLEDLKQKRAAYQEFLNQATQQHGSVAQAIKDYETNAHAAADAVKKAADELDAQLKTANDKIKSAKESIAGITVTAAIGKEAGQLGTQTVEKEEAKRQQDESDRKKKEAADQAKRNEAERLRKQREEQQLAEEENRRKAKVAKVMAPPDAEAPGAIASVAAANTGGFAANKALDAAIKNYDPAKHDISKAEQIPQLIETVIGGLSGLDQKQAAALSQAEVRWKKYVDDMKRGIEQVIKNYRQGGS